MKTMPHAPKPCALRATFAALILLGGSGCSFMMVDGAPREGIYKNARYNTVVVNDCTRSKAIPIVDIVMGGLGMIAGSIFTLAAASDDEVGFVVGGIAGFVTMAGFGGSGLYGLNQTSECVEYHKALIAELEGSAAITDEALAPPAKAPAVAPPAAPVRRPEARVASGCGRDTDCKGDRICVQGACAAP